jgi:hypothetical protein
VPAQDDFNLLLQAGMCHSNVVQIRRSLIWNVLCYLLHILYNIYTLVLTIILIIALSELYPM